MKLRNRIMSAVMAIVASMTFISATAFAADGAVSLKASATEVKAGETFTVEVDVTENPGIYYLGYEVTGKTAAFALTSVADSKLFAGGTLDKDYNKASYALSWFIDELAENNNTDTGVAVTLTYTVNAEATPGEYTISIADSGSDNIDFEGVDMGSDEITIKVVEDAPSIVPATATFGEEKQEGTVYGLKGSIAANDQTVTGVAFKVNNGEKDGNVNATFTQAIAKNSNVTFGVNIIGIPSGITLGYVADSLAPVAE